ncbi:hypothetical protein ACGH2B_03575 [Streptomyces sp. BBFR2]|uniref:hypothetical protein n=1 Tax=Streptomyces sp. BBFR2 TaxID=3372854 RepID=UPI0037DA07AC
MTTQDLTGAAAPPPAAAPRRETPRWLMAVIVFLLVTIPAGYIVISAEQSRDSGGTKDAEAAATGLTNAFPTKVQQRIYNVPVPIGSTPVYYYETNSWDTSSLFVQFRTNEVGLARYLKAIGTSTDALKKGEVTITPRQSAQVGWDFTGDGQFAGLREHRAKPQPSQQITVSFDEPGHPVVHTVSTVEF